jgi:hypothetical protein
MKGQRLPAKVTLERASHRAVADLKDSAELPKRVVVRSSKHFAPIGRTSKDHSGLGRCWDSRALRRRHCNQRYRTGGKIKKGSVRLASWAGPDDTAWKSGEPRCPSDQFGIDR